MRYYVQKYPIIILLYNNNNNKKLNGIFLTVQKIG